MATIINTPGEGGSSAGWAVAVVILIAVILLGLFVWPGWMRQSAPPPDTTPGANIQVNLPTTGGGDNTQGDAPQY